MTPEELEELGVYDPAAPDAEERLELVRQALDSGATLDEVRWGIAEKRLHAVAAIRIIEGGTERLSLQEMAARAGVDVETAQRLWRAFGLPEPDDDEQSWNEHDAAAIAVLGVLRDELSEDAAFLMARAIGAAMARLADTEVAMVRASAEAPLRTAGGGNLEVARALVRAGTDWLPGMMVVLDGVHRRHVSMAGRRYALWGVAPTEASTTDAVVGFADLVGSTTLGQQLDTAELNAMLMRFEARALEATTRPLARLVKLIGDEAMFVAGDVADAVDIVAQLSGDPDLPPLRAGIAAGTIIVREGDYFGPVVNLAARLVELAEPGQVVLDREAADRLGRERTQSLGTRTLAGFDDPVDAFSLST